MKTVRPVLVSCGELPLTSNADLIRKVIPSSESWRPNLYGCYQKSEDYR